MKSLPGASLIWKIPIWYVAVLGGSQVDDGMVWEIGYYYALKRKRLSSFG
jgi:hypothetical protein